MRIIKPDYYDAFHCLASACPDSCCKEWTVQVDPESAARYRKLPGALGEQLRSVMAEEDGETILSLTKDKRCPMWRDDGLCCIQAQMGEEYLCHTCRQFPRLRHDYGDFVELGLELSCPEAAQLILTGKASYTIAEVPGWETPEYDADVMSVLLRTRITFLSFLDEGTLPIEKTLAVLLLYGYAVQEEIDGGEPAILDPNAMLGSAKSLSAPGDLFAILNFFKSLEILTPQWSNLLDNPSRGLWSDDFRPLVKYFIARYWLQAVSDYDLIGRVKFIITSCLVIKTLGGKLVDTAQLFSKEVENDADNIDTILDGAYTSPALADIGLLGLLLED